ncbi:Phosphatidylserine decarboxylase proenzyme, mitochondrial [Hondaea fermentalgiana]|uniref:phosphatidylserine decarboxylase n=1 Tax=Hondaea fermentalgiana TaxID=2315210 RepID=A0A2R5G0Y2_9STRA|nr:Phosphatidylserine decarboxylase proenzyme, mitochondrial [Hondaea fermentalgiana]|eukprot:GBG24676.1 Phosphatidylserine decarboxylase proenzyme, mitochondrial [Hondaea fermentalgiana]
MLGLARGSGAWARGPAAATLRTRGLASKASSGGSGGSGGGGGGLWQEWKKYRLPVTLGFVCLGTLQARRLYNEQQANLPRTRSRGPVAAPIGATDAGAQQGAYTGESVLPASWLPEFSDVWNKFALGFINYGPPYRWLSHAWGVVAHVDLPFGWMREIVYRGWAFMYSCKQHEMRDPYTSYPSLSAYFRRPLKNGVRRVDADSPGAVVCPVDAKVLHVGSTDLAKGVEAGGVRLEQVKGVSYPMEDFVGRFPSGLDTDSPAPGRTLQTVVLYLAPGDYHHFHSPVDWTIDQRRHFPGRLLPVRPWAARRVEDLYCRNERVVLNGTWEGGFFSFGAVGALNVGSIDICFDEDVLTNKESRFPYQRYTKAVSERNYAEPIDAVRGQPVGSFDFGSTIVLVFEASKDFTFNVTPGQTVRVGERLGTDKPRERQRPLTNCPPWPGDSSNTLTLQRLRALREEDE